MLSVRDLERPGLSPISFDLGAGECISVMGPSGAGKTLLLRALADLDPNQGEAFLDGRSRTAFSGPAWRRRVLYLPSESGWWGEQVGDHFPNWSAAVPLLERLNLPAASQPWNIQRLSTGERQRLALVRALVRHPRVLLLDEPTSGLDSATTQTVEQLLAERLRTGVGLLWVTHDAVQARRMANRHFLVEAGQVSQRPLAKAGGL